MKYLITLISIVLPFKANALELPEPLESHHWPGTFHAVACSDVELKKIEIEIKGKTASGTLEAFQVIKRMLCSEKGDENFILSKMSNNLLYVTSDEFSDRIEKKISKNTKYMVYKKAWQPFIFGEENKLKISYRVNPLCFENFVIEYAEAKWKITEIGIEGCG
tara:strand:+ start:1158 stop:1646 length:489 start_codon:yes stop_codon:yes gene_type:complete